MVYYKYIKLDFGGIFMTLQQMTMEAMAFLPESKNFRC